MMIPPRRMTSLYVAKGGPEERRRLVRHTGTGLSAQLRGQLVDVTDISLTGIRIATGRDLGAGQIRFNLVCDRGDGQETSAPAVAMVVARGPSDQRMRFVGMNYRLARMIVHHIARLNGVDPYVFR